MKTVKVVINKFIFMTFIFILSSYIRKYGSYKKITNRIYLPVVHLLVEVLAIVNNKSYTSLFALTFLDVSTASIF